MKKHFKINNYFYTFVLSGTAQPGNWVWNTELKLFLQLKKQITLDSTLWKVESTTNPLM